MIYLDNGATSFPKPQAVLDKWMEVSQTYAANPGRSGHAMALKMDRQIFEVRNALTEFVGGSNPMNTIFTANCTDALNIAIHGLAKKGMHVITTSMEHNSVLRPLFKLKEDGIIELSIVYGNDQGLVDYKDIEAEIRDNTKIIVTTHVSNLVGTILDVKEIGRIARENGIYYILDAAQSIGHMPVDIEDLNVDIICYPGHKGLLAPMGTGGLYIRDGIDLEPIKEGGTGSFSSDPHQPDIYPDKLESGTENGPGIISMGPALEFLQERGVENIHAHTNKLKDLFVEKLIDMADVDLYGPLDNRQGSVVSLNIRDMDSSEVAAILNEDYEIYVRPGLHCAPLAHETMGTSDRGMVRFSFGVFNTEEEIIKAADAVKEIVESR